MTILSAVVLLGILIFVHELGHFLLAKMMGVKVLKFSLGFGPKVIGKTFGDTEYRISAFPLGGYVKMLGEEPGEELGESEREKAYSSQPVWKRFFIVFSGPLFNIAFAVVIFIMIFLTGVPVLYPDVGKIADGSPAEKAGLVTGDRVISINGKDVHSWNDIDAMVDESDGSVLRMVVRRDGSFVETDVQPEKETGRNIFGEEKGIWEIGFVPLVYPVVGEVMSGSRAGNAGMRKGDRIIEINGAPVGTWQDMTEYIHQSPETPLEFSVQRDSGVLAFTIVPERTSVVVAGGKEKEIGLIGIKPVDNSFIKKYGFSEAIPLGVQRTWEISRITVVSIVKLIQRIIPADTIGGPILIVQMAGQQASQGAMNFFTFMAIISINLGILNILPIPILDGGHVLFLGIEAIRRKPLSEKVIVLSQRVGLALLLTLMVFAFYNDLVRLFSGRMLP